MKFLSLGKCALVPSPSKSISLRCRPNLFYMLKECLAIKMVNLNQNATAKLVRPCFYVWFKWELMLWSNYWTLQPNSQFKLRPMTQQSGPSEVGPICMCSNNSITSRTLSSPKEEPNSCLIELCFIERVLSKLLWMYISMMKLNGFNIRFLSFPIQ